MALLPFQLFKAETRLIVHEKCLYKLKLTYKPDISSSSSKTLLNEKDEINADITRVIRAVFFLINAKQNIPKTIITQFFTVSVTVKFWKIAQKLGFSKNGSRLKSGHLIELALDRNESRIQETNTASSSVYNDFENENLENLGHLGLRKFVLNSDDSVSRSCSSSDDVTMENSVEDSTSAENEGSVGFSTNRYDPKEHVDKDVSHENYLENHTNQIPLTSDVSVQTPWSLDVSVQTPWSSDPTPQTPLNSHPTSQTLLNSHPTAQTLLNSHPTSQTLLNSHPTVQTPLNSHPTSQTLLNSHPTVQNTLNSHPTAQTLLNSHPTAQTLLNSHLTVQAPLTSNPTVQATLTSAQTLSVSVQALNKHEHLSIPLNETPASLQALPTFISSCTQTDFEELDATGDIFEVNPIDKAGSHVSSDHAYPKSLPPLLIETKNSLSGVAVSNSNKDSDELKENQNQMSDERVAGVKSSTFENQDDVSVNDNDYCSVKDDGDPHGSVVKGSGLKDNNLIEPNKDVLTDKILDSEPENNLCATHNYDSNASNDVWGIGNKSIDRSKVEAAVESQSDDDYTEKISAAHQSSQLDGVASNTEKSETSPEKTPSNLSKKRSKSKDKKPDSSSINVSRLKSLRSRNKTDTVLDQKPRGTRTTRNSSGRQTSVPRKRKTPSNGNRRKQRQKQESQMQSEVPTSVSFGLHDRYQVQTQELQEDLKLQDLAHPSSSDTKRKRRSLLDYINFSYFLRREKKSK